MMKGGAPSLTVILAKRGKPTPSDESEESESEAGMSSQDEAGEQVSPEMVDAMRLFERAKSPEEKAKAMRLFMACCEEE